MSLFQLCLASFNKPAYLISGKNKSFGKVFLYLLFLSVILCIPLIVQSIQVSHTVKMDAQKIIKKLPNFSIKNNQLIAEKPNSGLIYETDYLTFTFDPDGKTTLNQLQKELTGATIGIGLLKEQFVLAVADDNPLTTFLDDNNFSAKYDTFDTRYLNKDNLKNLANSNIKIGSLVLASLFAGLLPILFDLLFNLLLVTIFANMYSKLRFLALGFAENYKIVSFCATIPVIVSTLLGLIGIMNSSLLLSLLTFLMYTRTIKSFTNPN